MTLFKKLQRVIGVETLVLGFYSLFFFFSIATPLFFTARNLSSMAFQMPVLGLLTLAMLVPILSGGLNLAIIYTANISGLALAWTLLQWGGTEAGIGAFLLGSFVCFICRSSFGAVIGPSGCVCGAHPILVLFAMMIFLRGLGEFLTRGGDISGFQSFCIS